MTDLLQRADTAPDIDEYVLVPEDHVITSVPVESIRKGWLIILGQAVREVHAPAVSGDIPGKIDVWVTRPITWVPPRGYANPMAAVVMPARWQLEAGQSVLVIRPRVDTAALSYTAAPLGTLCSPRDASGTFICLFGVARTRAPAVHMVTRWGHTNPMCAYHSPFST